MVIMGIVKDKSGKSTRRAEAGAALVEAALTMTAFFFLLIGTMETGRFLNVQQVLTNAAREGARLAVAPTAGTNSLPSTGEIQTRVNFYLASANITGAAVSVTQLAPSQCGDATTSCTQVRVQYPYALISQSSFFNALQVTMAGQSVMRNETSN